MSLQEPEFLKSQLSSFNDRKDQQLNRELAERVLNNGDQETLVALNSLLDDSDPRIVFDVLITLGYIAEQHPELISPYLAKLLPFLESNLNYHIWAVIILLAHLVEGNEEVMFEQLPHVLDAMNRSTVIAKDHGIRLLVKLYSKSYYCEDAFALFIEQLMIAPDNQFGQYAERIFPVIRQNHKSHVVAVMEGRLPELPSEVHKRRILKIIRKYSR